MLRNGGRPGGCLAYEVPAEERNPAPDVRSLETGRDPCCSSCLRSGLRLCVALVGSPATNRAGQQAVSGAGSSTCDPLLRALLFRPIDNLAHDESSIMTAEAEAVAERDADG